MNAVFSPDRESGDMGDMGDRGPLDIAERGDQRVLSVEADLGVLGDMGDRMPPVEPRAWPSAAAVLASLRKIRARRYLVPNTGLRSRLAGPSSWAARIASGSGVPSREVHRRQRRQRFAENMRRISFWGGK